MDDIKALNISEEKKKYVTDVLNPLLEDMVMDALFAAPLDRDPIPYLIAWCKYAHTGPMATYKKAMAENKTLRSELQILEKSVNDLSKSVNCRSWRTVSFVRRNRILEKLCLLLLRRIWGSRY